jgi:hypothetical protein
MKPTRLTGSFGEWMVCLELLERGFKPGWKGKGFGQCDIVVEGWRKVEVKAATFKDKIK